jgi:hypothetical protein
LALDQVADRFLILVSNAPAGSAEAAGELSMAVPLGKKLKTTPSKVGQRNVQMMTRSWSATALTKSSIIGLITRGA